MLTTTRNASLPDLAAMLKEQQTRKLDLVVPATALRSVNGAITVSGAEPALDADGVTDPNGSYVPTSVFDGHLATRLDIPLRYLRRLRETDPELLDANVNRWLHGKIITENYTSEPHGMPDARALMIRLFKNDGDELGIARALMSDRYAIVDNLDVLIAVLSGVRSSGVQVSVDSCDLTDSRMYVKVSAPAVSTLAPELLRGYRSPYSGNSGDENPTVFAGFVITNSEVGAGAFTITPRLVVQVCTNGMTMTKDVLRSVHLGSKLDEGVIRWSEETERRNLDLVTSRAKDAVATFLDVDYVRGAVERLSETATTAISKAPDVIEHVAKKLLFSDEEQASVLDHFIKGGQLTAGGVMQAITSYVQTVADADRAHELEAQAVEAMTLAAAAVA